MSPDFVRIAMSLKSVIDQRRKVERNTQYPDVRDEIVAELDKLIDSRLKELGA